MSNYVYEEFGRYKLGKTLVPYRPEFSIILSWVKEDVNVLDVGCGDGALGKKLIAKRGCNVSGFDLDKTAVAEAKRKGIKARVWDANKKFPYKNGSFDVVICNETLEFLSNPNLTVSECLRVGKTVIIQFPNFGFWFYRLQFLLGRFPKKALFGYEWWNTYMLTFFSLSDFYNLPSMKNVKIEKRAFINFRNRNKSFLAYFAPNFFARSCILEISKY